MKIKQGLELREVCGEYIVVTFGADDIYSTQIISLNESAAYLWKSVAGKEFSEDDMVDALLKEYEVDEATARADVKQCINTWFNSGLIE